MADIMGCGYYENYYQQMFKNYPADFVTLFLSQPNTDGCYEK